jgi:hypothetical protein
MSEKTKEILVYDHRRPPHFLTQPTGAPIYHKGLRFCTLEIGNSKLEMGNWKIETRKFETAHWLLPAVSFTLYPLPFILYPSICRLLLTADCLLADLLVPVRYTFEARGGEVIAR